MNYKVQLEQFEGPLDLLLELIEKEKMDITEISLSRVADQYLEYIESSQMIDPSSLADFLVIAAKLILLKSKALLPELEMDEEEEESIEDLKMRLLEYKRYKEASQKLKEMYNNKDRLFERAGNVGTAKAFYPGDSLDIDSILISAQGLVQNISKLENLRKETIRETVSIKEKIAGIQEMLSQKVNVRFNQIIKKSKSRVDAIVSFLALLELIRQKSVTVSQEKSFSDIEIKSKQISGTNG